MGKPKPKVPVTVKEKIQSGESARRLAQSTLNPVDPHFRSTVLAYKYSSPPLSLFEKLYLNDFWEWFTVKAYPLWLPPNVITLSGFAFIVGAMVTTLYVSPKLQGDVLDPRMYIFFAFCLFVYQTLDGSDGKQARRTKSGSALGELMDHGADALATTMIPLIASDCFALGSFSFYTWSLILLAQACFYLSNLTLVHNGVQTFYTFDAMEVQTATQCVLILAGVMGVKFIQQGIAPVPEAIKDIDLVAMYAPPGLIKNNEDLAILDFSSGLISPRTIFIAGGLSGTIMNYFKTTMAVVLPYLTTRRPNKFQGLKALAKQLLLIHAHILTCFYAWLQIRDMEDEERARGAIVAFAIVTCFTFADIMDKLLVFRVGGVPFPWLTSNLALEIMFIYAVAEDKDMQERFEVHLMGYHWWSVVAAVVVFNHLSYFAKTVRALAIVLKIHPFRIKTHKA